MQKQFVYETGVVTYQIFPVMKSGEARLPLLLWLEGEKTSTEENIQQNLQQICKDKNLNLMIVSIDTKSSYGEKKICKAIQRLIFEIRSQYRMHVCETYLAGYREGAYGVSQMISYYPRLIAAAILIDGYGDPYHIRQAKGIPIWFIHESTKNVGCDFGRERLNDENVLKDSYFLEQSLRNIGAKCRSTELMSSNKQEEWMQLLETTGVDWCLEQSRRKVFRVEMLSPSVFRIDDYFMSSCYLIEGADKALLIDTGMGEGDFKGLISNLTSKPVILAITHPHPDHMYHAGLFQKIYIHENAADNFESIYEEMRCMDTSLFESMYGVRIPELKTDKSREIIKLHNGEWLDLGEDCQIQAAFLPGHTLYDCVFIDDKHQFVFTGDAVGSGYTVGIPTSRDSIQTNIENYKKSIESFLEQYADRIKTYGFLGGHFIQENGCDDTKQEDYLSDRSSYFNPLSLQTIEDMRELCKRVLQGDYDEAIDGDEYSWAYKTARIEGHFS